MAALKDKKFIFITGIEGSGTTMMLKLLDAIDGVVVLGGNYCSPDLSDLADELNRLTESLWDRRHPPGAKQFARLIEYISQLDMPSGTTHVVHKRSFPFLDPDHLPTLSDLPQMANDVRLVVMHRSLAANTRSILRRGFEVEKVRASQRTEAAHEDLMAQLGGLKSPSWLDINYEDIIAAGSKADALGKLAKFADLDPGLLLREADLITGPTGSA